MFSRILNSGSMYFVLLAAVVSCGCTRPSTTSTIEKEIAMLDSDGKSYVGQPLSRLLDSLGVPYNELLMRDEPPGKLRAVGFARPRQTPTERVYVWLEDSPALFDQNCDWPPEEVRKATIRRITVSKLNSE